MIVEIRDEKKKTHVRHVPQAEGDGVKVKGVVGERQCLGVSLKSSHETRHNERDIKHGGSLALVRLLSRVDKPAAGKPPRVVVRAHIYIFSARHPLPQLQPSGY